MTLSEAQLCFLAICTEGPYRTPFIGGRSAGRVASCWYRTAKSLADKGLVTVRRQGDAQVATITDKGRDDYAYVSFHNRHED